MNDLEEKLKKLELDRHDFEEVNWGYVRLSTEQIEQIKQAFKDAGYEPPQTRWVGRRYDVFVKPIIPKGYMTNQEWYDRFVALSPKQLTETDKLDFSLHDDDPEGNCYYAYNCAIAEMKSAAKKASGLA